MLKAKYFILLICLSFLLKAEAKVTLTSIWGDNMVLQQQSEVTFSGTATSGKRVQATASWNNKKIQTNVDAKGEWKLSLQTPVAGGPYSITSLYCKKCLEYHSTGSWGGRRMERSLSGRCC